ncbi:copine-8 [Thecamonas trahens ATCC 50062]|uniref:Copine-8 n=1 Tax=Thecamonas trahens ATCC 50062 TaxID=461836 RepID=A0A0L0DF49_THETB|nr:copine-8 [Thecamonas trahens ATCC 50062]KNC50909.1 copine-8 [Thecamonas trahens ATCC 50062]|eukprot:XP_013756610.1 copine-8 [Thecamonas trahens ATCC 50062]
MVVVFAKKDPPATEFAEVGRTEKVMNDLNPSFQKPINVSYFFEKVQTFRLAVLDIDEHVSSVSDYRQHDYIGEVEFKLSAVIGAPGMSLELPLGNVNKPARRNGFIRITAEEMTNLSAVVKMQIRGHNLDKMDTFGKSDPFLVLSRLRAGATDDWQPVHKTEVVPKNLNPTWQVFEVPIATLCNADYERPIRIECYDHDKRGTPDFIGAFQTTLTMLCSPDQAKELELINPKKQKKKKYRNSGILEVMSIEVVEKPSFIDYLAGGLEVNLIIGIDYTASNGNPANPSSLHYLSPYEANAYERAMTAVGAVVAPYDHDQEFPPLALVPGSPQAPVAIHGMPAVIQAYRNSLQFLALHGPTNFAPLIEAVIELAQTAINSQDSQTYYVVLILTDGEITDMAKTKAALVRASSLPISFIIVGVGDADFSNMEQLDGDDVRISANGIYAERDIVQFVPFRDFEALDPAYLAQSTLQEIPHQVLDFYAKHGIMPLPPRPVDPTYVPPADTGYGQGPPPPAAGYGQGPPPPAAGYGQGPPPPAAGYGQGPPPPAAGYGQGPPPPAAAGASGPPPPGYAPPPSF